MNKNKIQYIWLLIASLNAAKYALVELRQDATGTGKQAYNLVYNAIKTFFERGQKSATAADKEMLSDLSYENVAAMSQAMAICSQIPPDQIDWFCDEIVRLGFEANNRSSLTKTKNARHGNG